MNDYFDDLEAGLREAVRRRAHLPWHRRVAQLSLAHRGLAALVVALVIATPTVAAVGAVSGWWFGKGSSDIYYPASATSGLGKVLPKDGRLLPIRVADPAGGPPWGVRLVKTTRGETCIQVGRVVDGQIGALGIDGSWNNDHKFHEIKPNDQLADICGATDAAGNGFVNDDVHGAPASVDVPIYNGRHIPSPPSSLRMIEAGLLGPDAKSITYRTPSGQLRTENTAGGVGAYLVVFRQTASDCSDFAGSSGCGDGGAFGSATLSGYTSVEKITYSHGKSCSDVPWGRACPPVGWVNPKGPKLTEADVATPITVKLVKARYYCRRGQGWRSAMIACDGKVPSGYTRFDPGGHRPEVLVKVSFIARQPVTDANSWYEWLLGGPRNGSGSSTQANVHRGERIKFAQFEPDTKGVYHGTIAYVANTGQDGPGNWFPLTILARTGRPQSGTLLVGQFGFRLPLSH
jgi:hypothetical protein